MCTLLDSLAKFRHRAHSAVIQATCAVLVIIQSGQVAAQDTTAPRLVTGGLQVSVDENSPAAATVQISIGTGELKAAFGIDSPGRVVIDLTGVALKNGKTLKLPAPALVSALRLGVHQDLVRVVIDCQGDTPPAFAVEGGKGTLTVRLSADASVSSAASALAPTPSASQVASSHGAPPGPISVIAPKNPSPEIGSSSSASSELPTPGVSSADNLVEPTPPVTEHTIPTTSEESVPLPMMPAVTSPEAVATALELTTPMLPSTAAPLIASPTSTPEFTATAMATYTAVRAFTMPPTRTTQPTPKPRTTAAPTPTATPEQTPTLISPPIPSEGQVLQKISFELNPPGHTPAISIRVSQRGEFKLMKADDRAFDLVLPGYSLADERLALPQFPTDEFMGITFIQPERTSQGVRIRIGVDRGTRLTAVWRDNQIDITTR